MATQAKTMPTRQELKVIWLGEMGIAVRSLLHLLDDAGTWLWFEKVARSECFIFGSVTAGYIARMMLIQKLKHLMALQSEGE